MEIIYDFKIITEKTSDLQKEKQYLYGLVEYGQIIYVVKKDIFLCDQNCNECNF